MTTSTAYVRTTCKHCGRDFKGYVGNPRYCGDACRVWDDAVDVLRKTIRPPPHSRRVVEHSHEGYPRGAVCMICADAAEVDAEVRRIAVAQLAATRDTDGHTPWCAVHVRGAAYCTCADDGGL